MRYHHPIILLFSISIISCSSHIYQKPSIAVSIYRSDDTYVSYIRNEIESQATLLGTDKVSLSMQSAQNDQALQDDAISKLLGSSIGAVAVNIVNSQLANKIFLNAELLKKPIVFFSREPDFALLSRYNRSFYVGSKAQQAGIIQGQILASYFHRLKPRAIYRVVLLSGDSYDPSTQNYIDSALSTLKSQGLSISVLSTMSAHGQRSEARTTMDLLLAKYGASLDAVIAHNDDMALGAIDSLKLHGYFTENKYLPVVGIDGTPAALESINSGLLLGTAFIDPKSIGRAVFDLAYSLSGKGGPHISVGLFANSDGVANPNGQYVWFPYTSVTKDNCVSYIN